MPDTSTRPREDMPAGPLGRAHRAVAHSRRYLAALCFMMAATAALEHRAELLGLPQSLGLTILQFGNCLVALMWMRDDARLRGSPIPGGGLLLAGTFPPLTLPAYILWTRRWRGLLAIAVVLFAMVVAALVGQSLARLALGLPVVAA